MHGAPAGGSTTAAYQHKSFMEWKDNSPGESNSKPKFKDCRGPGLWNDVTDFHYDYKKN